LRVLAIETSCDETAVAIVRDGRWIERNLVASQVEVHRPFGGIVPEIASRAHLRNIVPLIEEVLASNDAVGQPLDAVAVTHGPGLAGALLVGVNVAKAVAFARDLPLLGLNHLEGHVYANWLAPDPGPPTASQSPAPTPPPEPPTFPLICLIVSGAHSEIVLMREHGDFTRLGRTRDDAAGEAFDKVARMLGLGFPGGPAIQRAAEGGDPARFPLPRAWLGDSYDFSFSGLKTAVLRLVEQLGSTVPTADVAASFQAAIVDVLAAKTVRAASEYGAAQVALAGGVAANLPLRRELQARAPCEVRLPALALCTDNAAMIGAAAYFRLRENRLADLSLDVNPSLRIA
jgi:N6-L-threonylcarbamoyladenine synthase